jgi:hypothetical protein
LREDAARNRKDSGPANIAVIRSWSADMSTLTVNLSDTYRRRGESHAMEAPLIIPNSNVAPA